MDAQILMKLYTVAVCNLGCTWKRIILVGTISREIINLTQFNSVGQMVILL